MGQINHLPPLEACGWLVRTARAEDGSGGFLVADCSAHADGAKFAQQFAASNDLASALHLVASKTVLTSGMRAVVDAALMKSGYLAAAPEPEPIRHVRICGEDL
ncbi:hypothetical protein [Burkholderia ubonensis]|uniref:hypothetical protein n=1 Tax=Burkholderia ubonensis TaxID=101571 RepID=UPI0009B4C011|nr:hypothetical protein [Burkholderia ubonensis]